MLLGDITDVFRLAVANQLSSVALQLFRPISVMLASPAETPADLVAAFPTGALVEDKFDGIAPRSTTRFTSRDLLPHPGTASLNSPNFSSPFAESPAFYPGRRNHRLA